jgi:HSP20 family protein
MTGSDIDSKKGTNTELAPLEILKNFRDEMEDSLRTWSTSPWIPSLFDYEGVRIPLCEIADKGDHYQLHVELPGMTQANVKVKAQSHCVEVSAKKSKTTKETQKGRIYTERSESSFYRQIPVPEEIVPQKVKSKILNGTLSIVLPKKNYHKSRNNRPKGER